MNKYKKWATGGVAVSIVGILVGCGNANNTTRGAASAPANTSNQAMASTVTRTVVNSTAPPPSNPIGKSTIGTNTITTVAALQLESKVDLKLLSFLPLLPSYTSGRTLKDTILSNQAGNGHPTFQAVYDSGRNKLVLNEVESKYAKSHAGWNKILVGDTPAYVSVSNNKTQIEFVKGQIDYSLIASQKVADTELVKILKSLNAIEVASQNINMEFSGKQALDKASFPITIPSKVLNGYSLKYDSLSVFEKNKGVKENLALDYIRGNFEYEIFEVPGLVKGMNQENIQKVIQVDGHKVDMGAVGWASPTQTSWFTSNKNIGYVISSNNISIPQVKEIIQSLLSPAPSR
ncbi:hypothetical protein [Alicyclobacillus sp. ALC3]|uniref:hypothetical protein n=1 Tax=Alicyclobacillus sp. ALC3 TaxID=2796143 RepID=UPI00237845BA|nr:hypothetical protein [Alicyclobacillus sp. ALC3]WDL97053.1 hypothetical protein JC200_22750 [Alicyclobacillus sp. ALC3]